MNASPEMELVRLWSPPRDRHGAIATDRVTSRGDLDRLHRVANGTRYPPSEPDLWVLERVLDRILPSTAS